MFMKKGKFHQNLCLPFLKIIFHVERSILKIQLPFLERLPPNFIDCHVGHVTQTIRTIFRSRKALRRHIKLIKVHRVVSEDKLLKSLADHIRTNDRCQTTMEPGHILKLPRSLWFR